MGAAGAAGELRLHLNSPGVTLSAPAPVEKGAGACPATTGRTMPAEPLPPQSESPPRDSPPDAPPAPAAPDRVRFTDLAGESVEVEIEHAGQIYRLRRTRSEKLLLTK